MTLETLIAEIGLGPALDDESGTIYLDREELLSDDQIAAQVGR